MILLTHFLTNDNNAKEIQFYSEKNNLLYSDVITMKLQEHQKPLLKPLEQLTENINLYDSGYVSKDVGFTLESIRNLVGEKSFSVAPSKNTNYVLIFNPIGIGEVNLFASSLVLALNLSLAIIFTHDKTKYSTLMYGILLMTLSSACVFLAFCIRLSEVDFNSLNIVALVLIMFNLAIGIFHLAYSNAPYKVLQLSVFAKSVLSLVSLVLIALAY